MLHRRGGIWYVKFRHGGRVYRESTGTRSRNKARVQEALIRARIANEAGPGGRQLSGVTLAALEELHIEHLEGQGYDERRIATVRTLWSHVARHLGGLRDAMTLTLTHMHEYEAARRQERWRGDRIRGQTIRRERAALMRGLKIAAQRKLLRALPFDPALLEPVAGDPKRADRKGKFRDQETIERVLAKLSKKAKTAGHEHMIRFVLATGLRAEEFERAGDWRVVRVGRIHVLVVPPDGSKTGDPRELPLSKEALAVFKAWRHRFAIADLTHSIERASKKAGVEPGVTLRDLRATYISRVAAIDLPAAQRLAGHRSVATTAIYVDTARDRVLAAGLAANGSQWGSQPMARKKKAQ